MQREQTEVEVTNDVVDDPDLIMRLTNKNARQRFDKVFEYAPLGWTHARRLAHELNIKESKIRLLAEAQIQARPELFKRYLTSTDILTTHYHPELSHEIRRHYMPELYSTLTPKEYADKFVVDEKRANELLVSAEDTATKEAVHFEGASYYPEKEYREVISAEEKLARKEQEKEINDAEDRYWQNNEKTEEETENEYWATFSPGEIRDLYTEEISFEEDEIEHPKKIPFLEEMYADQGDQGEKPLSEKQIEEIYGVLNSIPGRLRMAIIKHLIEGKTLEEAAKEMHVTRERVRGMEAKGLRMLRHPTRMRRLQNLLDTSEAAQIELDRTAIQQEIYTIESIPIRDLIVNYKKLLTILEEKKKGTQVLTPSEEKDVNLFEKVLESLHESDRRIVEKFVNASLVNNPQLSDDEKEKAEFIFNLFPFRSVLHRSGIGLKNIISPDGDMIDVYGRDDVTRESIGLTLALNFAKDKINKLQGKDDISSRKELKSLKSYQRTIIDKIKELDIYRQKYKKHFV